jgi:crotonobetainyl-CoA:carnitine CoA-transferase CaiB-like acyl-CoA transferase
VVVAMTAVSGPPGSDLRDGPLSGIRVLDLGISWAGPFAGMILADLGAEVIKLETQLRIDILRWSGAFADGVRDWERSGYYGACNRGKKSVTLNLKTERARELVRDLAAVSDVVIENFAPRVLPSLGLDFASLTRRNPRLIMASMSGFGSTGPERGYISYGDHLNMASGFGACTGDPDDAYTKIGTFYGDPVAGMLAAMGILAALEARDRGASGGQWLDIGQLEDLVSLLAVPLLLTSLGEAPQRSAARSPAMAPRGFFRCLGSDRWVAIAVRGDGEWRRFRGLLADDGIDLPEARTLAERKAVEAEIEHAVGQWCSARSPRQITAACQDIGIAALPVMDSADLLRDVHLHQRDHLQWIDRPITGPGPIPGVVFRLSGGAARVRSYAPLLGEHNEEIFQGMLGLSAGEFDALVAEGVIR